jgi:DNA invertase Pin-like site-specific DNA recombinase
MDGRISRGGPTDLTFHVCTCGNLGLSGSGSAKRSGFPRMAAEVALGHVGIVLALEVSRVARNNADWYRLFDLCGMIDTLIGDSDGIYHPALFNDRLVLGLKGIMSEAELHILRTTRRWNPQ